MQSNIISQYESLVKEIKEIRQDIEEKQKHKEKLERSVKRDIVKGGAAGEQRYKISDYDKAEVEETEYLINKGIRLLKEREKTVQETLLEIEEFINSIDDSRMRRMISLKYIHGKTWYQVAQTMGIMYSPDSCKKQVQRYLSSIQE